MSISETIKKWTATSDEEFLSEYTWTVFGMGALFVLNIDYVAKENPLAFWCWLLCIIILMFYAFSMADKFMVVRK